MRRKSFLLGIGTVVVLLTALAIFLILLIGYEPASYQLTSQVTTTERKNHADDFKREFSGLLDDIINKRQWGACFTQEQINSYLEEEFVTSGTAEKVLPQYVREPRVQVFPDRLRLAFRYGTEKYSTVVSIDVRAWLSAREPNVVALEIQGLRAGLLPVSSHTLLQHISEAAEHQNLKVTWYRHQGRPVALLRLQPYQTRPTFQLQRLELREGALVISGRSLEPTPLATLVPPAGQ